MVSVFSCKPPKQTSATVQEPPIQASTAVEPVPADNSQAEVSSTQNQNAISSKDVSYRLIVSFISIGEGTDRNGKEMLDSFLNEWKTNQKKEVKYETIGWGREGEVDFCFPLTELNEKEQTQFVSGIKEKFKDHQLIQFAENEPCRHKR